MRCLALGSGVVAVTFASQTDAQLQMLPGDTSSVVVRIDGKRQGTFADVMQVEPGQWRVNAAAPNGRYRVTWDVTIAPAAALALAAEMHHGGANQQHRLGMTIRGARTECFILNDETGQWQAKSAAIFDPVQYVDIQNGRSDAPMTVRFDWSFHEPG